MVTFSNRKGFDTCPHSRINYNGIGFISCSADPSVEFPTLGVLRAGYDDHRLRFLKLEPREDIFQIQLLIIHCKDLAQFRHLRTWEEHIMQLILRGRGLTLHAPILVTPTIMISPMSITIRIVIVIASVVL